jgi:hypothetical protein
MGGLDEPATMKSTCPHSYHGAGLDVNSTSREARCELFVPGAAAAGALVGIAAVRAVHLEAAGADAFQVGFRGGFARLRRGGDPFARLLQNQLLQVRGQRRKLDRHPNLYRQFSRRRLGPDDDEQRTAEVGFEAGRIAAKRGGPLEESQLPALALVFDPE